MFTSQPISVLEMRETLVIRVFLTPNLCKSGFLFGVFLCPHLIIFTDMISISIAPSRLFLLTVFLVSIVILE